MLWIIYKTALVLLCHQTARGDWVRSAVVIYSLYVSEEY